MISNYYYAEAISWNIIFFIYFVFNRIFEPLIKKLLISNYDDVFFKQDVFKFTFIIKTNYLHFFALKNFRRFI